MDKILISKNTFLVYLFAVMKTHNHNIVNKLDLEKKLYSVYGNEEFNILFRDINKTDNDKIVHLTDSFNYALAVGLISPLNDFVRYTINISDIQAKMVLSQNTILATMIEELYDKVYNKEDILFDDLKPLEKNRIYNQPVINIDELTKSVKEAVKSERVVQTQSSVYLDESGVLKTTGPKLVKKKNDSK